MTQGKKAEDETALTGWNHGYYSDKLKGVSLIRLAEQPIGLISLIDLLYTLNRPEATYKGWLMPTVQDTLQQPGSQTLTNRPWNWAVVEILVSSWSCSFYVNTES